MWWMETGRKCDSLVKAERDPECGWGSSLVAQWVKDVMSSLWLGSLLWTGVGSIPGLGTSACQGCPPPKKKYEQKS